MKEKLRFNQLGQWDLQKSSDRDWMMTGDFVGRDVMPKMKGEQRSAAIKDLENKTHSRINPTTNEKEFLLHRGVGEQESWAHDDGSIADKTSWSPYHHIAQSFSNHYNSTDSAKVKSERALSAWIPEKHIHAIPIHNLTPGTDEHDDLKGEHEVVVAPHKFSYATPEEQADAKKI